MLVFLGPSDFWRLLPTIPFHGAAFTGGLMGGYIAVVLMERKLHLAGCTGDLIAPAIPLAHALGRVGNSLAGDAYGTATSLPWGVSTAGTVRHPVQLYEAVLDVVLFALLWRLRHRLTRDGDIFRAYVVGYALIRFPLEFLRYQPTSRTSWISPWYSGFALPPLWASATSCSSRGRANCICDLLPGAKRKTVALT